MTQAEPLEGDRSRNDCQREGGQDVKLLRIVYASLLKRRGGTIADQEGDEGRGVGEAGFGDLVLHRFFVIFCFFVLIGYTWCYICVSCEFGRLLTAVVTWFSGCSMLRDI